MVSFLIFLIACILFLFEIGVSIFFGNPLSSDIYMLIAIMILPGIISLLQKDITDFQKITIGVIGNKVKGRKQKLFLLNKGIHYSIKASGISTLYCSIAYYIGSSTQGIILILTTLGFLFFFSFLIMLKKIYFGQN